MVASEDADKAGTGGQTFRGPTGGPPKSATARSETERVDIERDVAAFRQESLCAPGPTERLDAKDMTREIENGERKKRGQVWR